MRVKPDVFTWSLDIILFYGAKADQSTLVHFASWCGFAGSLLSAARQRLHSGLWLRRAPPRYLPNGLVLWLPVWEACLIWPSSDPGGETMGPSRYL